jgi:hypothetical protein
MMEKISFRNDSRITLTLENKFQSDCVSHADLKL